MTGTGLKLGHVDSLFESLASPKTNALLLIKIFHCHTHFESFLNKGKTRKFSQQVLEFSRTEARVKRNILPYRQNYIYIYIDYLSH